MSRTWARTALAALVATFGSPLAAAQTVAQSGIDLTADGRVADPDVDCAFAVDGIIGWFDRGTQSLFVSGSDSGGGFSAEIFTAAEIDQIAGTDAVRCRAADYDPETETAVLILSDPSNVDFVFAIGTDPDSGDAVPYLITSAATGAADGVTGVVVANGRVYVGVRDAFNDPPAGGAAPLGNGIYSFALAGSDQTAAPVVVDPNLSPVGLDVTALKDGQPFALVTASNRFGSAPYQNKVVQILDPEGAAAISVLADPFDGHTLTVPSDPARFNITSVAVAQAEAAPGEYFEAVFVLNNNFDGPNGEEVARFSSDGSATLFTSEARILSDLGRTEPGYTTAGGPNALLFDGAGSAGGNLYLLNSSAFGGADEVLMAVGAYTTPAEAGAPAAASAAATVGPNPFRERLGVTVGVAADLAFVAVFDALGREVARLHDGPVSAGQRFTLDGGALPAGVYLVRVSTPAGTTTTTVSLVR